jgi:uncharacterized membrane protein YfcA
VLEVLVGFVIALSIGLSGVGGGTITAPVLILFLGIPAEVAVGTALLFSVFAKIPAGLVYFARKQVNLRALTWLLAGGVPAVAAGSLLLGSLKSHKDTVLLVIGLTIIAVALINLALTFKKIRPRSLHPAWIVLIAAFIGLEVGFSSAGAGALGTLLLMSATRLAPKEVVGTDICFGLILSAIGGGLHAALGQADFALLLKIAAGGLLGSLAGVWLAQRIAQRPFRLGLLLWLMFIGSHLVLRSAPSLAR